jgi:hypothetical protein
MVINAVDTGLVTANLVDAYSTTTTSGSTPLHGVMRVNQLQRMAEVTDGLSNTIFIVEDGGRPPLYRTGSKYIGGRVSGAGWADRDNEGIMHGENNAGTGSPGPCAINCSNDNEIYSFHPGGSLVLAGDGSVHFLSKAMDIRIVARLITRSAGESAQWE